MSKVRISVQGELNDLLPKNFRFKEFEIEFQGRQSSKHIIESLGIPHTEIGKLIANKQPTDFDYLVQPDDQLSVIPASPICDLYSGMFDDGSLTIEPRFILDNHLGKLATYLRVFGFDAIYRNDFQDEELATYSVNSNRILITRDRQLLMRKSIRFGCLIRSLLPEEQILEMFIRFNLTRIVNPYNRCLRCNVQLVAVDKKSIIHRLQPKTKKYYEDFHICPRCERIYWKGSHFEHMHQMVTNTLSHSR